MVEVELKQERLQVQERGQELLQVVELRPELELRQEQLQVLELG